MQEHTAGGPFGRPVRVRDLYPPSLPMVVAPGIVGWLREDEPVPTSSGHGRSPVGRVV